MKKLSFSILLLLICSVCWADQSIVTRSSGLLSSNSVIVAFPARLVDMAAYTDGTNTATVVCYDNASAASGTIIGKLIVSGSSNNGGDFSPVPRQASNGIYCTISGTGAAMIIYFDPQ